MNLIHTVYEPKGRGPHPTLLAMHGRGANAQDLLGLAPHISSGRFLMICPQAPLEVSIGAGTVGYAWFSSGNLDDTDVRAILSARDELEEFLAACLARYAIDPARLVVLGFSQGGVMAYSLALGEPGRFAALAALSTRLPPALLDHFPSTPATERLPTLIQHGSADSMIAVDRAREAVEALRRVKVPVIYREYSMGHEINAQSLGDLSNWLDEKVN
ncbi:MAG TPA: hypothetical protein VGB25_02595 [Candidatus Binatia bacterium]